MKRISGLVPQGEHFDSSALNGEGIWFTVGHVNNIENELEANAASILEVTGARDALQLQLTEAQQAATTSATQHQQEIATRDQQIETLTAEIANMKKSPAGEFQTTSRGQDEFTPGVVPSYEDANNPINKFADSVLGRRS
jgi:hypothetical protein